MLKIFGSVFLLIFLALHVQAQMFTKELGYAVAENGDTLKGEVRFKNSHLIYLIPDGKKKIEISPKQFSTVVTKSNDYFKAKTLSISGVAQHVFLRHLMDGDVAFYEYIDIESDWTYYIQKEGDELRKLNKQNYNFMRKKFLVYCDSAYNGKKIGKSDFRRNIIEYQIETHNARCSSVENPFKYRPNFIRKVKFGINIGLNLDYRHPYVNLPFYNYDTDVYFTKASRLRSLDLGPLIGATIYIPLSKNFIVAPELNVSISQQIYTDRLFGLLTIYGNEILYSVENQSIRQYIFDITPISIIYRTDKYKFNPNFSIGFPILKRSVFVSVGFDFKLHKKVYSKIQLRYSKNDFTPFLLKKDYDTDDFKYFDNFKLIYTLIF
jgi:hypothetical protein